MQVYYYGTYPRGPFPLISQAVKNEIMGETRRRDEMGSRKGV